MKTFTKFACVVTVVTLAASQARAAILASDTFSYPDGDLTVVSGGTWTTFSGTNPLNVSNQQAFVTAGAGSWQDDQIMIGGGPHSNDVLYASFDVTVTGLAASPGGSYFALFKDVNAGDLFARVYVTNEVGAVRIGIGNQTTFPTTFDGLLTLGTTYKIVVRYDQTGTSTATLWVNPTMESDPNTVATDVAAIQHADIVAFGLRQSNATQAPLFVDNLLVGTSFADVIPEPSTILLLGVGLAGLAALRRRRS
jgi:hypothetical protein